ncbi:MAG: isoprenyl transferase [Porphyromonadaceae bacterium]|nr:MAG: isoprenyl transferase [Porphyromonadaceae bacterium]
MSLKDKLIREKLPRHVAIIMDGNGRWAMRKGAARIFGHQNGVTPVDEVVKASAELGIDYLTLYAFSTENWGRPVEEIDALMGLLVSTIKKETKKLLDNNIRLLTIGDLTKLPENTRMELVQLIEATAANTGLTVVLALSYSSRYEIILAAREIIKDTLEGKLSPDEMNCDTFERYLQTAGIPDPELLIRTSGEFRISNFLLYQLAYTELYFTSKLWPDFNTEDYYEALLDYQNRERRFGKTSEQL